MLIKSVIKPSSGRLIVVVLQLSDSLKLKLQIVLNMNVISLVNLQVFIYISNCWQKKIIYEQKNRYPVTSIRF
jgi:hypothetical protein